LLFNNKMPLRPLKLAWLPKLINKSKHSHNQNKVPRLKLIARSQTWSLRACLMSRLKKLTLKQALRLNLNTRRSITRSIIRSITKDAILSKRSQKK